MLEGYDEQPDSELIEELFIAIKAAQSLKERPVSIIDVTFLACLLCSCLNLGQDDDILSENSFEDSETDKAVIYISDMLVENRIDDLKKLIEENLVINNRFLVIVRLKKEGLL